MLTRILRVTGIEFYKLRHRAAPYVLVALLLAIVVGQAAKTAFAESSKPDRTRELNAYVVFADASGTGLLVASVLLVLYASVVFSGEVNGGTLKGLLTRPVTRLELLLGKVSALLLVAFGLGGAVIGVAAAMGRVYSRYEGLRSITHNIRDTRVTTEAGAADPSASGSGRGDLIRLGFSGHWDAAAGTEEGVGALRIDRVREGSPAAEDNGILEGDIVTHVAAGDAKSARLASYEQWERCVAGLGPGDSILLKLDHPVVTAERYFTSDHLLRQAGLALATIPLALVAVACFGLLWSALVDGVGISLGGALLSFLVLRFPFPELLVSVVWLVGAGRIFAEHVRPCVFTSYLWLPMEMLRGNATGVSAMEIKTGHVATALLVCGVTALVCFTLAVWRFRVKDVL